jgi:hypothetical protein
VEQLIVVAIVVGVVVMWVSAVSAARLPEHAWKIARRSKRGTLLGIVITGGFGGLYYWLAIRREVRAAVGQPPPPDAAVSWSDSDWPSGRW